MMMICTFSNHNEKHEPLLTFLLCITQNKALVVKGKTFFGRGLALETIN